VLAIGRRRCHDFHHLQRRQAFNNVRLSTPQAAKKLYILLDIVFVFFFSELFAARTWDHLVCTDAAAAAALAAHASPTHRRTI
jgi:hypothetical protein